MSNGCSEKQIFFNKYKLQKLINKSEFSYVYQGINIKSKELVAIKLEDRITMKNILESEAYILFNLKGIGIPNIISYGKNKKYNILVEELLGPTLNDLSNLKQINKGFPIKDICMIALQGLDRLEFIHSKNIIHRDIKPHNFLIGRKDEKIVYLIDFGFAKKYRSSRTGKFIKFTKLGRLFGSLAFSSINANAGYEQSRRDDLESFGYMLIYLIKKYLPWMELGVMKNKKEEANETFKLKKGIKLEKVCEGIPEEFKDYIKYCQKLEFEQEPNYNYLRNLFALILIKKNQKNDLKFFWINKKKAESITKNCSNNSNMRRDTYKRLYNSVKKSLEKKSKEKINNTLKTDYSKVNDSLDKINDIQKNKKGIQKINFIHRTFDKKNLNDKISIKNYSSKNNINEKTFPTSRINEQKYNTIKEQNLNQLISKNDSNYNSKNQSKLIKIKPKNIFSDNKRKKNNVIISNKYINSIMNIIRKNYSNFEDNINNNYQGRTTIINNYITNNYCNKIVKQIPFNNYNNKMIPKINYAIKYKILGTSDNRFENHNGYSFQNEKKNIRTPGNKNRIENYITYSFQNYKK